MGSSVYEVLHFHLENGRNPVREWLNKLNAPVRARIQARIARMSQGNFGDQKRIDEHIYEAKIMFGPGYRLYFSKLSSQAVILLLCGGDKKSQSKDIQKAKQYWSEYQTLSHEEER